MKRLLAFALITAASVAVPAFLMSAPTAAQPPVQRWEYTNCYCSEGRSWMENEAAINKLGAEGWEMVTTMNGRIYFKRPL